MTNRRACPSSGTWRCFSGLVLFTTKEDLSGKVDPSEMSDAELFEAAKSVIRRMKEAGEEMEVDEKPAESAPIEKTTYEKKLNQMSQSDFGVSFPMLKVVFLLQRILSRLIHLSLKPRLFPRAR